MTNAELLAKIKAEIERRKKSLRAGICNEEVFTRRQRKEMLVAYEELDRLNRFLSTLESENSLGEEYSIEIGKYTHTLRIGSQSDIDNLIHQEKQERPGVELEKEINRYLHEECSDDDEPSIHEIAEHFAKWGAEHLADDTKTLPKDLDFENELYNRFGQIKDFTLGMRIGQYFYDLGCRRTAEKYDEIEYNRQRAEEHLATSGKTLEIKPGDEVTINGHKIVYDKDKGYVTIVKSEESVPKDLALTIQDLELLHTFLYAVKNNKHGAFTFTRLTDEQYAEVLKRYLEAKK